MLRQKLIAVPLAIIASGALLAGCSSTHPASTTTPSSDTGGGIVVPTNNPQMATPSGSAIPPDNSTSSPQPSGKDSNVNINNSPSASSGNASSSSTASPTSADTSNPSHNSACVGVDTPIKRGDPGYTQARDANNNGVACEPGDGDGHSSNPSSSTSASTSPSSSTSTSAPATNKTNPSTTVGGASRLPYRDGTVVWVNITSDGKIYVSPDSSSETIGDAQHGGSFKGTITGDSQWVKIDRSNGYVQASILNVSKVIS